MFTKRRIAQLLLVLLVALIASACNLVAQSALTPTANATTTITTTPGTITPTSTLFIPTLSGQVPTAIFPTSIVQPTAILPPTAQPLPIRIVIISPTPGSIVAGTISVFGSAVAPNFLQYQLEYGPEPNTGNLWYPADTVRFAPVQNGLLGQWNTSPLNDGVYTLRLRVFLRDGTVLTTSVNGIQVRNARPTPQPTPTSSIQRPVAAFSHTPAIGEVPLNVRFINQSFGPISSYRWDFGDGGSSTEINPTYTYLRPGLYNVTLTATGPGGVANVSAQVSARGPQAPRASFTADRTDGDSPLVVQFTDTSSGTVSSYFWNFGDGQTTTERSPRHTFNGVGTFNVFLTVTGPGGTSVAVQPIVVRSPAIPPPAAAFTFSPSSGTAPLTVQFNNASSGTVSSYSWNFGDGTVSNATSPIKIYQFPGTYTVTLLAFGPGGQGAATGIVTVVAPPPTATFTPTFTTTAVPPTLTPTFTTTSVPPTETPTATETATETTTALPPAETATETPTETATAVPPTETATETPTETTTAVPPTETPTETATTTAVPPTETPTATLIPPPVAAFSAVVLPDNSLSVQFSNLSTGEALSSFTWDFGDGLAAFETNPVHTYAAGGTYSVTLTALGAGGSNSFSQSVTVVSPTATVTPIPTPEPVNADFNFAADGSNPLLVQFTSLSSGPVGSYFWNFGDGFSTSSEQNPAFTYGAGGSYNVSLTVTSSADGTTSFAQQTVTVVQPIPTPEPVNANFSFAADVSNPLLVQFTSLSSGPVGSYFWNFGDGFSTSSEQNPAFTYAAGGSYNVSLTVTSSADGTTSFAQQIVTVVQPIPTPEPVNAGFSFAADGSNPLLVQFTSLSSGPVGSYFWNFGDGFSSSSEQNPAFTYAAGGDYNVSLTVTSSADGTTSFAQQLVTVMQPIPTPEPVNADFTFLTAPDNPLLVQFTSLSTGPVGSYFWNFGDGFSTSSEQNPVFTYAAGGDYNVSLTVTSSADGTTSFAQQIVTVVQPVPTPEPVVAAFSAVVSPDNPLGVTFTDESGGPVASYQWNFGDGSGFSPDSNPSYIYSSGGTYDVTLIVTAADGVTSDTITQQVTVEAAATPEPPAPAPLFTLVGPNSGVFSIAYNPGFNLLAAGDGDGTVTVWDMNSQTPFVTLANQSDAITAVAWSPDGGRLASASLDGTVVVVETASWTPLFTLPLSASASAVAYSPNGATLATSAMDGSVQFWDSSGAPINAASANDQVYWLAWRPDGSQLAYTGREQAAVILDAASATPLLNIPIGNIGTTVAWNPTGTQLLVGTTNGASVFDPNSGIPLFPIQTATDGVTGAWSPNGSRIAVGSSDGETIVTDAFGAVVTTLPAPGFSAVTGAAWNANNGQLAISSDDGSIQVWQP